MRPRLSAGCCGISFEKSPGGFCLGRRSGETLKRCAQEELWICRFRSGRTQLEEALERGTCMENRAQINASILPRNSVKHLSTKVKKCRFYGWELGAKERTFPV